MRASKRGMLIGAAAVVALTLAGVVPASAATVGSWGSWAPLSGAAGAYTSSVSIAALPAVTATVTTDSRGGQVGIISGATNWLAEGTPVGAKYGSSAGQPYLNLRPRADTPTGASTTTYSFATPTPTSGWTFVLGDIDADAVRIQAIGENGAPLTAAELGFRGGFNYCAPGVAGKPGCTGAATDVPTWDPATLTLTGNAAAADTSGAAAWFEPSAQIRSLTFFFTRRSGFPVYQTWFASLARDITGTVAHDTTGPLGSVALTLTDRNGAVVASTTTAPDGSYSFPGIVATGGYTVSVAPPAGMIAEGPSSRPADLTNEDATADFVVRDIVPVAVSGRVTDGGDRPVGGVVVEIDGQTATTDSDGRYLFDAVPVGTHTATITVPGGYTQTLSPPPFTIELGDREPITGVDFRLAENPSLAGTVRANGSGVAGVTVTATGPSGTVTAVTDAAGGYRFPRLLAGEYTVTMTTPGGFAASGPSVRTEAVAGTDIVGVDFALVRLGAFDGTVRTDKGVPVGGAVIRVVGPGGEQSLTTAPDGTYGLDGLPPGTYTLTVLAPAGTTVVGAATRTVVITAAGEAVGEQDFTLAAVVIVDPPDPDPDPGDGEGGGSDPGVLPGTGSGPETLVGGILGGTAMLLGATLLLVARRRVRGS